MDTYHKINSIYKRDAKGNMIMGDYSLPEFQYLAYNEWAFTEKVDGTNIRVIYQDGAVRFGGKTNSAQLPSRLVTNLYNTFTAPLLESVFGTADVCLYGEGYGAGIQKAGSNYQSEQDFVLFDVKIKNWWLERNNITTISRQLGIPCVPTIGRGTLLEAMHQVSNGLKSTWGEFFAEGIVARPLVELQNRGGERIITKIKHKDFIGTGF